MKNKDIKFFKELSTLCDKAPDAMRRLRRMTGKFGYVDIHPMDEKRWNDQCWEDYGVLVGIASMLQRGKTVYELDEEIMRDFPLTDSWISKCSAS